MGCFDSVQHDSHSDWVNLNTRAILSPSLCSRENSAKNPSSNPLHAH